nr:RNA-directed DNA polymerase, eukaryota, reverse transcriptase zinc-binding domain protein [Tanacetum cinerariifolium]
KPRRKDTQVPQVSVPTESVVDKAVYKELDDKLVRATTTASSLEVEQDSVHGSSQSPWRGILSMVKSINLKGVDLLSLCHHKLSNEEKVLFWDDCWCGDQSLKSKFPRIYSLDNDKGCNVANRLSLPDWGSVLRRNSRGGIEASQFKDPCLGYLDLVAWCS